MSYVSFPSSLSKRFPGVRGAFSHGQIRCFLGQHASAKTSSQEHDGQHSQRGCSAEVFDVFCGDLGHTLKGLLTYFHLQDILKNSVDWSALPAWGALSKQPRLIAEQMRLIAESMRLVAMQKRPKLLQGLLQGLTRTLTKPYKD